MKNSSSYVSVAVVCCLLAVPVISTGCGHKAASHTQASSSPTNQVSLEELNRALAQVRTIMNTRQQVPTTNDVADFLAKYHKTFPVPPAGQKLILNPNTGLFEMVDE
jgi:hypothetical protein